MCDFPEDPSFSLLPKPQFCYATCSVGAGCACGALVRRSCWIRALLCLRLLQHPPRPSSLACPIKLMLREHLLINFPSLWSQLSHNSSSSSLKEHGMHAKWLQEYVPSGHIIFLTKIQVHTYYPNLCLRNSFDFTWWNYKPPDSFQDLYAKLLFSMAFIAVLFI